MDSVVLLKDAPNRDNALKFMNFLLDPENAATVTNYAAYSAGVTGVEPFLDDEIQEQPRKQPAGGSKASSSKPATRKPRSFTMPSGPTSKVVRQQGRAPSVTPPVFARPGNLTPRKGDACD